jgi:hypothetical protein
MEVAEMGWLSEKKLLLIVSVEGHVSAYSVDHNPNGVTICINLELLVAVG